MFYIYSLQSKNHPRQFYFGFTRDLKKRVVEHNKGLNISTKRYKPWELIYYEACLSEIDAKRREKYLKTTVGRRMFKKRIRDYLLITTKN